MPEQFTWAEERHAVPLSIREADFTLYLSNDRDEAVKQVWVGGCLEELQPEMSFEESRWDVQGNPYGRIFQSEEKHRLRIKELWVQQRSSRKMPLFLRNQRYVLVVRWYDQDNGTWVKHSYYRVTISTQGISTQDEIHFQDLDLSAFFLVPESGAASTISELPDLTPTILSTIRYVGNGEKIDLYSYDYQSNQFEVLDLDLLEGRAEIVTAAGYFEINIDGTTALRAEPAVVRVNELRAIGGTFALGVVEPRIEIWVGPNRIASLTKSGELAVPNINEGDDPATEQDIEIRVDGAWVGSFIQGLATVAEIAEDLS